MRIGFNIYIYIYIFTRITDVIDKSTKIKSFRTKNTNVTVSSPPPPSPRLLTNRIGIMLETCDILYIIKKNGVHTSHHRWITVVGGTLGKYNI